MRLHRLRMAAEEEIEKAKETLNILSQESERERQRSEEYERTIDDLKDGKKYERVFFFLFFFFFFIFPSIFFLLYFFSFDVFSKTLFSNFAFFLSFHFPLPYIFFFSSFSPKIYVTPTKESIKYKRTMAIEIQTINHSWLWDQMDKCKRNKHLTYKL